jgi:hypothetical protein
MTKFLTGVLAVVLVGSSMPAAGPESLPAPQSVETAPRDTVLPAPATVDTSAAPSCASGACGARCHDRCLRKFAAWFFYCEHTRCCCQRVPPTPPIYTYFPPCREGPNPCGCNTGCGNGFVQKCGFCASGTRMYGLFSGHGFGLCGGPGVMGCSACK